MSTADTALLQRRLQRHALALLLLAFAAALMIPLYPVARTGLAAHVIGITGGLLLIGVASFVPQLRLAPRALKLALLLLVGSVHLGFLTQWIGALGGLSRMFVVTAAGRPEGLAWLETAVEVVIKGITPLTFVAVGLLLWGLRGVADQPSRAASTITMRP
jgi:(hydroxyamino)benzene mutase